MYYLAVLQVRSLTGPTGLKSRCQQGCVPLQSPKGESISLPFSFSKTQLHSLSHGPLLFNLFLFLILPRGYVDWFLEKEEGRVRHTKREKHWLVVSHRHANQRLIPQPRYVPWPGIKPITFWCTGWCSNQLSHLARAHQSNFLKQTF